MVGTVWVLSHGPKPRFDTEDARLLASLARFAAVALRIVAGLETAQPSWVKASLAEMGDLLEATREQLAATRRMIEKAKRAAERDQQDITTALEGIEQARKPLRRAGLT